MKHASAFAAIILLLTSGCGTHDPFARRAATLPASARSPVGGAVHPAWPRVVVPPPPQLQAQQQQLILNKRTFHVGEAVIQGDVFFQTRPDGLRITPTE